MEGKRSAFIIGTAIAVAIGVLGWATLSSNDQPAIQLTEITDSETLRSAVALTHISIATSENFAGQKVRVISGALKNASEQPLGLIELKMTFVDSEGKAIQESVHPAFGPTRKPLAPGSETRFELRFENLPKNWNYRVPIAEIAKVGY